MTIVQLRLAHIGINKIELARRWAESVYGSTRGKRAAQLVMTAIGAGWTPEQFAGITRIYQLDDNLACVSSVYEQLCLDLARGPESALEKVNILEVQEPVAS